MTLEGNGTVEPVLANFRCALKDLEEQFTHLVLNYAKVVDDNEALAKDIERLEGLLEKTRRSSSIESSPFQSEKSSRSASMNRRTVRAFSQSDVDDPVHVRELRVKTLMQENDRLRKRLRKYESSVSSDDEPRTDGASSPISRFVRGRFTRGNRISRLKRAYADTTNKVSTMVQSRMGLNQKEKDKSNYELLGVRAGHRDAIQEICCSTFSPGILASASLDRKVKIWTDCQSDCLATYTGHSGAVNTVRLHSQSNLGISGSGDGEIHVWSFDNELNQVVQDPIIRLLSHESVVNQIELLESDRLISCSSDQTAQVHDLTAGRRIQSIRHMTKLTTCDVNSLRPTEISTAQSDGTVSIWDIRCDPSSVCVFNDHRQTIWSAKFFGENQIVTSGVDKTVRIFDVRVGRCVETISILDGVNKLAVNNEDGIVLIPSDSCRLRLLHRQNQPKISRLGRRSGHSKMISCCEWIRSSDPLKDGDNWTVATGAWDHKICLWKIPHALVQ